MDKSQDKEAQVHVWEDTVEIPTYGIGKPDKNPMFLEKRVYQGSSGTVYPYPVIDKIQNEKQLRAYHLICLENEYLHIEIMPEIGGRVYRALDKTNGYDFVYYNRVIKPALVGLAGPWISGGIEFNWPQHHRPNTFGPVEHIIAQNADGSKTAWVSEIDRMYGTKMAAGFTLYPGKAYLEVQVLLYNRTPEPQTFLWWANPAVASNEQTQSVFPPDVHFVFDHGRRDVSRFPIATGTYYKMDYSAGVDISRHKNIAVPTSYMAEHSKYDFVGSYDHALQAGVLHVANHHISPGKKQWTWGNGEFGRAWERNLTDEDGAYVELMAGVYTDNQPDFSWLQPYEEKSFKQYFMPYKDIGMVKNASIDAAVNLVIDLEKHQADVRVYATDVYADASIELKSKNHIYLNTTTLLSPTQTFTATVSLNHEELAHNLTLTVRDANNTPLVVYTPEQTDVSNAPEAAQPIALPEELSDNEALYLAGQHLEQYRHATFQPDGYYLEGLERNPGDIRINVEYGKLLLRRGLFRESEQHFRQAIKTLTQHNPNPYDGEAYYQLGVTLKLQHHLDEAFSAFYKSVWSAAWQDPGYFSLAQIACMHGRYEEALNLIVCSLVRNLHNYKARHLKSILLRKLQRWEAAKQFSVETSVLDITDFGAYNEQYLVHQATGDEDQAREVYQKLARLMRRDARNFIALATDYSHCGLYEEAIEILKRLTAETNDEVLPMVYYYLGYFYSQSGDTEQASFQFQAAKQASSDYCFPNTLDDLIVLESALVANPDDGKARYYLGNLLYDKQRYYDAIYHWESARNTLESFPTVHRNLALAYYNKLHKPEQALISLEKAFAGDPDDARVLYELDQLRKQIGEAPAKRLRDLASHWALVEARDDLYLEYVTLLNTLQQYEKALEYLARRLFHPWEGGEGRVVQQYILAHVELGKRALASQHNQRAIEALLQALHYPENLGEGKLLGTQENNIYYYLGIAYERQGLSDQALSCFQTAAQGLEEPSSVMFYNDQPPDMIFYQGLARLQLNDNNGAESRFRKLIDYGELHLSDQVSIDYFAVSLPDFLLFENDLQKRNEIHCHYMMGLGHLGLHEFKQAITHFDQILKMDVNHQGARIHREMCHGI
jgi:tetratricopeptide (TPR) repeat protein